VNIGAFNYKLFFTNLGLLLTLPVETSDNRTTQCEALEGKKGIALTE